MPANRTAGAAVASAAARKIECSAPRPTSASAPRLARPPIVPRQSIEVPVRALGLSLVQASLYGLSHGVTAQALLDAVAATLTYLKSHDHLSVVVVDNLLVANDKPIDSSRSPMRPLVECLREFEVGGFSLRRGISQPEIIGLVAILAMRPGEVATAGGFRSLVEQRQFSHVKIRRVAGGGAKDSGDFDEKSPGGNGVMDEKSRGNGAARRARPSRGGRSDGVEDIAQGFSVAAAYLNDDRPTDDEAGCRGVQAMADDPEGLSWVICDGVDFTSNASPESLARRLLAKVSLAYKALSLDPVANTQTGKRRLAETLRGVKEGVINRVIATSVGDAAESIQLIGRGVDRMADGVMVDSMVAEYVGKHGALEKNEQRLLQFITEKGLESDAEATLRDRLVGAGFSEADWRDLVAKARPRRQAGVDASDAVNVSVGAAELADLFTDLDRMSALAARAGNGLDAAKMNEVLMQIDHEFEELIVGAEAKMKELEDTVQRYVGGQGRDEETVAATLGEIMQEICQPLNVVNCTVSIIRRRAADRLGQAELRSLDLAVEGGQRLQKLINKVSTLVKEPDSRVPDAALLEKIYV